MQCLMVLNGDLIVLNGDLMVFTIIDYGKLWKLNILRIIYYHWTIIYPLANVFITNWKITMLRENSVQANGH